MLFRSFFLGTLSRRWRLRSVTQVPLVALVVLALPACRIQAVKHSSVKAAFDANRFLKLLYFDENSVGALEVAHESLRQFATPDDLTNMVALARQERGRLKRLSADSYLMGTGTTIELFYIGEYEKGLLYHRVVLIGDASSGYRVSGIWFQREPYPNTSLKRKFDTGIYVD